MEPLKPGYVELSSIPTYSSAQFTHVEDAFSVLRVTTSFSDHLRNITRAPAKSLFITPAAATAPASLAQDSPGAVASAVSPSGAVLLVLREVQPEPETGGAARRFVEVWRHGALAAHADVTALHGEFYTDDVLAASSFAPAEDAALYTAEAAEPGAGANAYDRFRFAPDFGERLTGKRRPTVFVVRWAGGAARPSAPDAGAGPAGEVRVAALAPDAAAAGVAFGQAVFAGERTVYATGFERGADARQLGVVGCFNRPAGIWALALPEPGADADADTHALACAATRLTPPERACRSPRVVARTLVWLSHAVGGPHHSCARLHARTLEGGDARARVLVDTVDAPAAGVFPGLYVDQLPARCALALACGPCVATHTVWGARSTVLLVALRDGARTELTPADGTLASWTVLCTDGRDRIVCARSAPNVPNVLVLGTVDAALAVSWRVIDEPELSESLRDALRGLSCSVVPIPDRHPVETLVIRSNGAQHIAPCITMPHGGPHVATTTAFNALVLSYALQGYTISQPNYTGSLGFGEKYVNKLMGRCGSLDVEDCIESVRHLIRLGITQAGPGQQFIHGGSHGGFLGAHLLGQHPAVFAAAVLRNPVTAAGAMFFATDIPDWCAAEFGAAYAPGALDGAAFGALQDASPAAHAGAVRAPVLLLVGARDRRVPPAQGVGFYHALRARGQEVEMLWFPADGHALDTVECARLGWEAGRDWFARFGPATQGG